MKTVQDSFTKPERYILCPGCKNEYFRVDHLAEHVRTAWYCDQCGIRFRVHALAGNRIECEVIKGESKAKRLVILRSDGPVTLHLHTFTTLPDSDETGHAEYFYNEHTCPTNFLGDVVKVIDADGDDDPHGIFAFVSIGPRE